MGFELELEEFFDCVILVEGKKDIVTLKGLGFENVFAVHKIGMGVRERVEQIVSAVGRSERFCVLMDFDASGRKLQAQTLGVLAELGARVDLRLRRMLRREGVSHLEGLGKFIGS